MFNKAIHGTTLTTDAAGRLFSNIVASDTPDQSFLATLRALLRKRLPTDESVQLYCKRLHYSANDISYATTSDCMSWFVPEIIRYPRPSEHIISIVYTAQQDAGEKMLETVRTNIGTGKRHMSGYTRRDDLKVFYARSFEDYDDCSLCGMCAAYELEPIGCRAEYRSPYDPYDLGWRKL